MTVPQVVVDEIEKTIVGLNTKAFEPDPIAGAHFSKITSVMSSAYKRHGFILELAMLESLKLQSRYTTWRDEAFQVSTSADALANNFVNTPQSALNSQLQYEPKGQRTLQVDLIVYDTTRQHLAVYEVKRGAGFHDAGKRRQILRDIVCMELLARSYGMSRGLAVQSSRAHIIFYYGKCSIREPFALTGDDLDSHFGYPMKAEIEEANALFKSRLFGILSS